MKKTYSRLGFLQQLNCSKDKEKFKTRKKKKSNSQLGVIEIERQKKHLVNVWKETLEDHLTRYFAEGRNDRRKEGFGVFLFLLFSVFLLPKATFLFFLFSGSSLNRRRFEFQNQHGACSNIKRHRWKHNRSSPKCRRSSLRPTSLTTSIIKLINETLIHIALTQFYG